MMFRITSFLLGSVVMVSLTLSGAEITGKNLVKNGNFSQKGANGKIKDWMHERNAKVENIAGKPTLVLNGANSSITQYIPLKPLWKTLHLSMRMKGTDIVNGGENWKNGRLAMCFKNAAGKRVGDWPNVFGIEETSDWQDCERDYKIPQGATVLELNPANFGKSGKVEFQNISLVLTKIMEPLKDVSLPVGTSDIWNLKKSWRQQTPSREKICLNGLWRFIPETSGSNKIPAAGKGWGWFKVPGIWPAGASWDTGSPAQEFLLPDQIEEKIDLQTLDQGWYQREITIPSSWAGKKILLDFEMVQTHSAIYIDGKKTGEILFPGGEVDITAAVLPGQKAILSILHTARPLEKAADVFMAPDRVFKTKTTLKMKGITGDVYLLARPEKDYITDTHVITSTRKHDITFDAGLASLEAGNFQLTAEIFKDNNPVKTFNSKSFSQNNLRAGRFKFTAAWPDPLLWDTHTPGNLYTAKITLKKIDGAITDQQIPFQFGFREFWIDGRDFYLNGKRIHLRALFVNNICNYADKASFAGTFNTCTKIKEYGFNFLITSNYNFSPGVVSYMNGLFKATEKTGVLAAFSLPHGKDYNWQLDKPEQKDRYQKLCQWLIRQVQNNPSVIAYSMNHNATGYYGDQNPLKIDGIYSPETTPDAPTYKLNVRKQAMLAAAIAKEIDPTRPVYHHQSGNLGDMHTVNCYLNWAPRQERSDWLRHWSEKGTKPVFFVEWGLPHISSWSSYRGPEFIWRCQAFQSIWDSEFASAITNQDAYKMTKKKEKILEKETKLWATGKPFYWGGQLSYLLGNMEHNYLDIQSWFAADNWRSFRMMGASAMLPWDQGGLWTRVKPTKQQLNSERYKNLQQPGIVPDNFTQGGQYIDELQKGAFEPSSLGKTFLRWNQTLIAFIGGNKSHDTEKSHNYIAGQTINKQLVVINDSREKITCNYSWILNGLNKKGNGTIAVEPGNTALVPIEIALPENAKTGDYNLTATFDFGNNDKQEDTLSFNIIGKETAESSMKLSGKIALFDPVGKTEKLLKTAGIPFTKVDPAANLSDYKLLIIGKNALAEKDSLIDLSKVKHQLNILVFEQQYDVLTNRLGFRSNIIGLRRTFVRNPAHPGLRGISDDLLRDWQGASTLTEPYLQNLPAFESHDPQWNWNGFINTRVWRCGNIGNTASVLIEKPPRGNWMPLVDGGFNLQYSPLLEYRDDKGIIIFCQMDLTDRTESEPVTTLLCRNLVSYLDQAKPGLERTVYYAGNNQGAELLKQLGIKFTLYKDQPLTSKELLVVGPEAKLKNNLPALVKNGSRAICLGLNAKEVNKLIPNGITVNDSTEYPGMIEDFSTPEFAGISNSELFWRTKLPLAAIQNPDKFSNISLAKVTAGKGTIILSQAAPWMFDYLKSPYLRNSYRRNLFLISRLLGNQNAASETKLRSKFNQPVAQIDYPIPQKWVAIESPDGKGIEKGWNKAAFDDSAWKPIKVPGTFEEQRKELADYDGYFWYRIKFKVPEIMKNNEITLNIGPVDDESWVWINDHYLGEVTKKTNPTDYYRFPRAYKLKPGQLNFDGENTLVVKIADWFKQGGIMGNPALTIKHPNLDSYYIQKPISDDNPYRYYRW